MFCKNTWVAIIQLRSSGTEGEIVTIFLHFEWLPESHNHEAVILVYNGTAQK